ncbi:MAG TPA: histidine phosphatase family protein [Bdellovibrionales bacterium]|jgi:broad specificity phosphatase PhoE|nr:histidine phosphatase family protein [Bdellovibrionales bacterium]
MKTLYIFRHGETDWNRSFRFQGSTDIPLNDTGRAQALVLREFFRENPVEAFFSSDLHRARETAEIARGETKVPIIVDSRLRETNLGLAEGLTHEEVQRQFGDLAKSWSSASKEDWHVAFPEGESKFQHLARLLDGLKDLLTRHPYEKVGVASHGGAIRRLIHHMRPELSEPVMIANCVLYEMHFDETKGLHILDLKPRR